MAELIRCDQCRVEAKLPIVGWLKVENFGLNGLTHNDWRCQLPMHFCTGTCLRQFLKERANEGRT